MGFSSHKRSLYHAVNEKNAIMVGVLLKKKDINLNIVNKNGNGALMICMKEDATDDSVRHPK